MNDNFLEDFNQGHFGECGRLDLSLKIGKQSNEKQMKTYEEKEITP